MLTVWFSEVHHMVATDTDVITAGGDCLIKVGVVLGSWAC
jgi:hypothetical protein